MLVSQSLNIVAPEGGASWALTGCALAATTLDGDDDTVVVVVAVMVVSVMITVVVPTDGSVTALNAAAYVRRAWTLMLDVALWTRHTLT